MAKKTMILADAAKLMETTSARATSRLVALGYTVTCTRCGGSGRYSWNQIDGDRCFGCSGSRVKLKPLTEKLVLEAVERIKAGELADYFARGKAQASIKAKVKAFWALYMNTAPGKAYSALSLGTAGHTPEYRAMGLLNAALAWVNAVTYDRSCDPRAAVAKIDDATAAVHMICAAWAQREQS